MNLSEDSVKQTPGHLINAVHGIIFYFSDSLVHKLGSSNGHSAFPLSTVSKDSSMMNNATPPPPQKKSRHFI